MFFGENNEILNYRKYLIDECGLNKTESIKELKLILNYYLSNDKNPDNETEIAFYHLADYSEFDPLTLYGKNRIIEHIYNEMQNILLNRQYKKYQLIDLFSELNAFNVYEESVPMDCFLQQDIIKGNYYWINIKEVIKNTFSKLPSDKDQYEDLEGDAFILYLSMLE